MTSFKRIIGWPYHKPTSRRLETQQQESRNPAKTRFNAIESDKRPLPAFRSAVTVAGAFSRRMKRRKVITQHEEPTFDLTTCHQQPDVLGPATCSTCGEEFIPGDDSELTPNLRQYTLHAVREDHRVCLCNLDAGPRRAWFMAGTRICPVCHVCIEWLDTLPMIKQPRTLYRGKIRGPLITFLHLPKEIRNQIYSYCLTVFQCSKCPRTATGNCLEGTMKYPLFPDSSAICRVCRCASWRIRTEDTSYLDNDLGQHRALVHVNRRSMGKELRPHDRSAQPYCPIAFRTSRRTLAAKGTTYDIDDDRLVGVEQPSLTRTCREIREESLPMWYGNQTFFFTIFENIGNKQQRSCQKCKPPFHRLPSTKTGCDCASRDATRPYTDLDAWFSIRRWLKCIGETNAASIRSMVLVYSSRPVRREFASPDWANTVPMINRLRDLGLRIDTPGVLTWRRVGAPCCGCESCVMKALRLDESDPKVVEEEQRYGRAGFSKADVRHCR